MGNTIWPREAGFYWVRAAMSDIWTVADWTGERFLLPGSETGWYPEEMEEIGQRIEPKRIAAYIEPSTPSLES